MARNKEVLTTGEVARICKVAPRTVTKWFDSGQLRGYRIPGSKDRRIPVSQLMRFMRQNNMPLDGMLHFTKTRVLIVDDEADIVDMLRDLLGQHATYDVQTAATGFQAGIAAEKIKPHVILLDINLGDINGRDVCKAIRMNPDLQMTKVVAMSGHLTDDEGQSLQKEGFDGFLKKPFSMQQVVQTIEDAVAVVY
ncbi:MAG TPA: response regulator [Phycisphaerae bacterium]|nr:response regulator [Phycisphaerae bacterium]